MLPKTRNTFTFEDLNAPEYYVVHHTPMGLTNAKAEALVPRAKRQELARTEDTNQLRDIVGPLIIEWNLPNCEDENIDSSGNPIDKTALPIPSVDSNSWNCIPYQFSEYIVMQLVFSLSDAVMDYDFFMKKRNASSNTSQ